ncbi:hypothetical protein B484DRAFT_312465, partial [Ochromonadaceae sp. CCMP2298]
YLSNLCVAAAYRRRGVGQLMCTLCEKVALSWGRKSMYLHVESENARARTLYERMGY